MKFKKGDRVYVTKEYSAYGSIGSLDKAVETRMIHTFKEYYDDSLNHCYLEGVSWIIHPKGLRPVKKKVLIIL